MTGDSNLDAKTFAFAQRLASTGAISDPWIEGRPRFRAEPIVLRAEEARAFEVAAEEVAELHNELVQLITDRPEWLDSYFALSEMQKALFLASVPLWHGIARADAFMTPSGIKICELNSDTPSGEPEAILLGRLGVEDLPQMLDPSSRLGPNFAAMVEAFLVCRSTVRPKPWTIAILYPTEIPEDLSVIGLYRDLLESMGHRVLLGSPFNLEKGTDTGVEIFGHAVDGVVRHYKTDWWTERQPVWKDEAPFEDEAPLYEPLEILLPAMAEGRVAVVNPFGAVLTQNKRCFAFFTEERARFSPKSQAVISNYIPQTHRLETEDREQLRSEREEWVLKSDYGCEGDEVLVGRYVSDAVWNEALEQAIPERWIVQRRFDPVLDGSGAATNFGVYVVAGEAAGFYARIQAGPTDGRAQSAGVLVEEHAA